MSKKKLYIETEGEKQESKTKPGEHRWEKQNLVSNKDGSDDWKCIYCDKKKNTFIPGPDGGQCKKAPKLKRRRLGWWTNKKCFKESKCPKCGIKALVVPKERHSLSKLWKHKRHKDELLVVCPDGCLEEI